MEEDIISASKSILLDLNALSKWSVSLLNWHCGNGGDMGDVMMMEAHYPILSHKIEIFQQIFHLVMNEWLHTTIQQQQIEILPQ